MTDDARHPGSISRRELLRTAGAAGAAALIPTSAGAAGPSPASAPASVEAAPAGPMMSLTAREAEILGAVADRLIPSDELGPGALEAGALRFIDRALSGPEASSVEAYRAGLAALDRYSVDTRGAPFLELSPTEQDSVLIDVQEGSADGPELGWDGSSSSFFNMVKGHTWQGTFGDPQYGGNVNFIGWDLLAYPGVRMRATEEDQRRLEAGELEPVRRSAYEYGQFRTRAGG